MIPHGNDLAIALSVRLGLRHTVARGDDQQKMIGVLDVNLDGDARYGFSGHVKGPWTQALPGQVVSGGSEAVSQPLLSHWLRQTFPDLADIQFAPGAETFSGDFALPVQWREDVMFISTADGHSVWEGLIIPAWGGLGQQSSPPVPLHPPPPLPPTPASLPPAQPLPDFASLFQQLNSQIERFAPIIARAAADAAAIRDLRASLSNGPAAPPDVTTITPAKRPNESLPPKNPRKGRR